MTDGVWERWTGRVIPIDEDDRALLMHGFEPSRPDQPYWFTIGGGVDTDESAREAAARELREETGLVVEPEHLGDPVLRDTIEFSYGGRHVVQHQEIYTCRLTADVELSLDGLEEGEVDTVDGCEWVSLAQLRAAGQQIEGADVASYVQSCLWALSHSDPPRVRHVVATAALVRDGRVLLALRSPAKRWYPDCWDFVGGHLDDGETTEQAMVREVAEELGVRPTSYAPWPVPHWLSEPMERFQMFRVDAWEGEVTNAAPEEHVELRWFAADELDGLDFPDPRYADVIAGLLGASLVDSTRRQATSTSEGRCGRGNLVAAAPTAQRADGPAPSATREGEQILGRRHLAVDLGADGWDRLRQ